MDVQAMGNDGSNKKTAYGNWVSATLIGRMLVIGLVFALAAALLLLAAQSAWLIAVETMLGLLAVLCFASAVYFVAARRQFADNGGGVQHKIVSLVMDHVCWEGRGKALDIGCGSGALAIRLAKLSVDAVVTGTDYWGGSWGYLQKQCEANAEAEGVAGRMEFVQASASKLPFADGTFDLAVSNLVFHEVSDCADKRKLLLEALRVVKPGGSFCFQDLFQIRQYYGDIDGLLAFLRESGVREINYIDTSKAEFIPGMLRLPFMVGTIGLIYGVK